MSGVSTVFKKLFGLINSIRKIIVNLVFFLVLAILVVFIVAEDEPIIVPDQGVVVVKIDGILVEEKTWVDPVDQFVGDTFGSRSEQPETLLRDVLRSIELAAEDERISGIYLDTSNMAGGGLNKLEQVGEALLDFRETGKTVVTYGDYFSQSQYYLAAYSDSIYLNPLGGLMFEGMGAYRLYYSELLDKLKVSTHVFKAGAYKSAVEPYTRTDMSDEAREAASELYTALWSNFTDDLRQLRDIDPRALSGSLSDLQQLLQENNNDLAQFAVASGLVDELKSREEFRQHMIDLTGLDEDEKSWRHIGFQNYLTSVDLMTTESDDKADEIALVVARGTILDGYQKPGMIGGDSTAALLRKARLNDKTKAVVLRIDSPGGSGFASEVIRQEVLELQEAGIPVIASMSTVAASGGYWIAASADQIWASPDTITGSIGVFGLFFTIEDSLAAIGVYNDGFQTTEIPVIDPTRELPQEAESFIQQTIDKFYRDFVTIVADGRGMSYEAVHEVAQGRVWTGAKAQELGLVDSLGDLEDAVVAAAQLAGTENYELVKVEPELSPRERFLQNLFGKAMVLLPENNTPARIDPIQQQLMRIWSDLQLSSQFNDPQGVYALCELCPVN